MQKLTCIPKVGQSEKGVRCKMNIWTKKGNGHWSSKKSNIFFSKSKETYGYWRITVVLRKNSMITINHKKVQCLMNKLNLCPRTIKRKYHAYRKTMSNSVYNLINRNFVVTKPNQKLVTDITEFSCPWGKVYLFPILWLCPTFGTHVAVVNFTQ